jgi:hypothetical protein
MSEHIAVRPALFLLAGALRDQASAPFTPRANVAFASAR